MKQVIIGIGKDGKPYVVSCPRKVEVIFKTEKKRGFHKTFRTMVYRVKTALGRS